MVSPVYRYHGLPVKKSDHEMKTILQDAVTLLKLNMRNEFRNAELLDGHVLLQFNGVRPKL